MPGNIMTRKRICVIGAGKSGLKFAIKLQEVLGKDYCIHIYANKFLHETTSHVAAGEFRPDSVPSISGYSGKSTSPDR